MPSPSHFDVIFDFGSPQHFFLGAPLTFMVGKTLQKLKSFEDRIRKIVCFRKFLIQTYKAALN